MSYPVLGRPLVGSDPPLDDADSTSSAALFYISTHPLSFSTSSFGDCGERIDL